MVLFLLQLIKKDGNGFELKSVYGDILNNSFFMIIINRAGDFDGHRPPRVNHSKMCVLCTAIMETV